MTDTADTAFDPDLLAASLVFQDLPDDRLAKIAAASRLIDVPAGTRICAQGSAPTAFFLLIEGQVGLSNTAPNGSSVVVEVLHPGAHFMMSSVLARLPMLMNADATAASRVIAVDGEALYALIETDAAIATAVLRAEALDFRAMVRQVCDLKLRTTAQRLGCYLLEQSQERQANSAAFRLPFDKRLLAAKLGCRQENLSRAFAALRAIGVETHGSRVVLQDIKRLRDYAVPDEPLDAAAG
jgi:CRP/FNR family transcriptional activator FtrB